MATASTLEKSLTKRLRNSLSATEIKQAVKTATAIQKGGIDLDDVQVLGTPHPDLVTIRGHLPLANAELLGKLLGQLNDVRELRVFTRGIVNPDRLRVHIDVGR